MNSFKRILEGDIDVAALMDAIPFSEDQIAEAAVTQTPMFSKAANLFTKLMRERMKLELQLKARESNVSLAIRKRAKDAGEKLTEGFVDAYLLNNGELRALREKLHDAEIEEHSGKLLLETLRQRKSSIENVIDIRKTEASLGYTFNSRIQQQQVSTLDARAAMKRKYTRT